MGSIEMHEPLAFGGLLPGEMPEVLVVEDSPTQAKRLERVLRENGFAVRVARDGQAGLEAVRERKPTVVITDVMMPRMDGFEMCRCIKEDRTLREIPVMVLTSLSDPQDIIRGLHCGADNFLTKPYGEEYLLRRLRHILTNQELRREGHSQMSVEVFFAGERHSLTADRMQIIDLLLSTFEAAVMQTEQIERLNGETRDAREEAKQLQENFRTLLENLEDAVAVVGQDGLVRYANGAAHLLLGEAVREGTAFPFPLTEEKREVSLVLPDGTPLIADLRVTGSTWNRELVSLATLRDVTETALMRERLKQEALTDYLTGLYNRRGFMTLGEDRLQLAARLGKTLVCLFLDLDGFKDVNDTLGHDEGDTLLRETADVLRETFRASDLIGRIGGDEFAVLLLCDLPEQVEATRNRLQTVLENANARSGRPCPLALSMGLATKAPGGVLSLEDLMDTADKRMYKEKNARKGCQETP